VLSALKLDPNRLDTQSQGVPATDPHRLRGRIEVPVTVTRARRGRTDTLPRRRRLILPEHYDPHRVHQPLRRLHLEHHQGQVPEGHTLPAPAADAVTHRLTLGLPQRVDPVVIRRGFSLDLHQRLRSQ